MYIFHQEELETDFSLKLIRHLFAESMLNVAVRVENKYKMILQKAHKIHTYNRVCLQGKILRMAF